MAYSLVVNGQTHTVDTPAEMPLLWVLRDSLHMKGTKFGCGVGQCGACTVQLDGAAVRSCQTPISTVARRRSRRSKVCPPTDRIRCSGVAGTRRAAVRILSGRSAHDRGGAAPKTAKPTDAQIDTAMNGNVCRCGTYMRIKEAIHPAANGGRRA